MTFKACKITGSPRYDALPVAKITTYPLEPRDYKPYAQCVMCLSEDALLLRMWAFEVSPMPQSCLRAVFYLFAQQPDTGLCVDLWSNGTACISLLRDGAPVAESGWELTPHPYNGEDLQGVYWGGTLRISLDRLKEMAGSLFSQIGDIFLGNFYKLCPQEPFVHYGCFFPADFAHTPYTKENMGTFTVVGY